MIQTSLKDIYVHQLQDLHSANGQCLEIVRELAGKAKNQELRNALEAGVEGIRDGQHVLSVLIRHHGGDAGATTCKAMEGLVKEARIHVLETEFESDDVRDAVIIAQYQRMVHYAIAGYGCLVAFARKLELDKEADKIRNCLDQTTDGDRHMTEIAVTAVNESAA